MIVIPKYRFLYTDRLVLDRRNNPLKKVIENKIIRNKPKGDIRIVI